ETIKRGAELTHALTPPRLHDLGRARTALETLWPFLREESDLSDADRGHAEMLADLMAKETFFHELPAIDEYTHALEQAYTPRHEEAVQARAAAYTEALATLQATPGWEQLNDDQQQRAAAPLATRATTDGTDGLPIPLLRADLHACSGRCNKAIEEMVRLVD